MSNPQYAMQAGTWSAIGFPVTSSKSRDTFYKNANFCYQVGVLVSRSSGTVWKPGLPTLWLMPFLQVGVLVCFTLDAHFQWWYDESLLVACGFVGLVGGAVYVNGFRLVSEGTPPELRELAAAGAAVSSDIGTNFGEGVGHFIQKILYAKYGIKD